MEAGKAFKIGNSFVFAAQIPDNSVGCSGSRCSNCGNSTAYCDQICRCCNLPFVGPAGFPQFITWKMATPQEKKNMVLQVYCHNRDRGRLGYANVEYVPLSPSELREIERLTDREAHNFQLTHGHAPQQIRRILLT